MCSFWSPSSSPQQGLLREFVPAEEQRKAVGAVTLLQVLLQAVAGRPPDGQTDTGLFVVNFLGGLAAGCLQPVESELCGRGNRLKEKVLQAFSIAYRDFVTVAKVIAC